MSDSTGWLARVLRGVVVCLLAGFFYSAGFHAGYDQGEGRLTRRQLEELRRASGAAVAGDVDVRIAADPPAPPAALAATDAETF